jgi:hypothetical protein
MAGTPSSPSSATNHDSDVSIVLDEEVGPVSKLNALKRVGREGKGQLIARVKPDCRAPTIRLNVGYHANVHAHLAAAPPDEISRVKVQQQVNDGV